jgi:hypothetical protein
MWDGGDQVLDLACGTGTFVTLLKTRFPDVNVIGLDGFDVTQDNFEGRLPIFLETVGFGDFRVSSQVGTILGTLDLMSAKKSN